MRRVEEVRTAVNGLLHRALGAAPCETACTHVVAGTWTALGVANAVAGAAARESSGVEVGGLEGMVIGRGKVTVSSLDLDAVRAEGYAAGLRDGRRT